ncbi:MAG: hypothetical protein IE919_10005 [Thioclava sp.]|nr:hypothetical protein [Thioclava sp.]MBD3803557.1 hypothetical protein [Thioclava sp.]
MIEVSKEITQLSTTAGVGVERFQSLAYAAQQYGIEQEKLSDILKDVNDKVGDFMANGAGPLQDFFTNIAPKVGVTAEQFRGLSSADALGLYVKTLQDANVSQAEMTFYLEALASDATRLAPLFLDNASALKELEGAARDLGVVIDGELIEKSTRMGQIWDSLMATMQARFISFAATVMNGFDAIFGLTEEAQLNIGSDNISRLADERSRVLDQIEETKARSARAAAASLGTAPKAGSELDFLNQHLQAVEDEMNVENEKLLQIQKTVQNREEAKARLAALIDGQGQGDGTAPSKPAKSGGGSSAAEKGRTEFEQLQARLQTETETIEATYQDRLAKLTEFREAELITEQEFADAKLRIQQDHAQAIAELEASKRAAQMQAMSGAFGDLASLMQSSNKKLFAIGKAAAIAEATVSGYQAAVDAWQKGMKIGGPPVAAAFTAASLAKTGMLISKISSQQASGSGGGGGSSSGGTSAAPASSDAAQAGTYFNVTLTGGDVFSRDSVRGLITMINDEIGDGAQLAGLRVN